MTVKTLPRAPEARPCASIQSNISPRAYDQWNPGIRAVVDSDEDRSISIYDIIGQDWWTGEGVTAKRVASALRQMGAGPVTVNINSPGGDMFEGLAIYNLLREHQGEVTVKVLALAASAASVIAMAGDVVQISRAGFLMIHNCWFAAAGNRNDFREYAEFMEPFDTAMADIYAARTGKDQVDVQKQMDAETWIGGSSAIEQRYADELLPSDYVSRDDSGANASAVRRIESALRSSGLPRSKAQQLIHDFKSSLSDSAGGGARDATGRGAGNRTDLSSTAALAASLTNIIPMR